MGFTYVWEYRVQPASVVEFESAYGPTGVWVSLFRGQAGYLRTELFRDLTDSLRYVTIDYWRSKEDYESFRRAAASQFDSADRSCARLTSYERHLGDFGHLDTDDVQGR